MNIHTFKDAVTSRRDALANEIEEDDDNDDGDAPLSSLRDSVDGEEDDGKEKV
jgi:hypothetical protein